MRFFTITFFSLFTLLVLELFTRFFLDNGMNYEIEMQKYALKLKEISINQEIGIEHKKNKNAKLMGANIFLDSNGFRNSNSFDNNKKKILMLGDSMTFGWGAKNPFPNIMNEKLKDYDVINAGIGNTNSIMQIENFFINFKDLYNYDIIVLNFFINDLEKIIIKKPNLLKKYSLLYTFSENTIKNLSIKNNLKKDWINFYKDTFQDKENLNNTLSKILKINNYCIKNKIKFYIHNIPELRNLKNYNFNDETNIIKNFSLENNINFLNSYEALSKEKERSLWVSEYDSHANDKAHLVIANFLISKMFD